MKPNRQTSSPPRGFTLIVTVAILVLLAVIAVGLLSLSTVTLRSARQDSDRATARANARLALMMAIGELQSHLGPDRRVTQTSDPKLTGGPATTGTSRYLSVHKPILPDPNSSAEATSPWKSRAADSFATWLVSGPPNDRAEPTFPATSSSGHKVRLTSHDVPADDSVLAPTVPVASNGSLAWWIDDLGQKASLLTTPAADESIRHITPDRFLVSQALPDESMIWFPDSPANENRKKFVTPATAGVLAPDNNHFRAQERWLGSTHRRLLTDTRRGSFKKDLSNALQGSLSDLEKELGERIFPPSSTTSPSTDPGGPQWAQLHSFYQLASNAGPLPVRPQTSEEMGIYPLIAGFVEMFGISNTLGYSPAADPAYFDPGWFNSQAGGAPNFVMTLHMAPVLKLWNPYSRSLQSSDFTVVVGNGDHQYADGVQSIETELLWAGVRPSQLPAAMRFEHRYYIPATSFSPGEVKLFSLKRNTFLDVFGGRYRPQTGRSVGKRTDVVGKGYILGELGEGPFTGHSFWDMHCTKKDLAAYSADEINYVSGRATGGWTQRQGNIASDGGDIVINDSANSSKTFSVSTGNLATWSLQLFQGRVPKAPSGNSTRPLVSIKNINTSTRTPTKSHPNIPELNRPTRDPYFAGNRHLDATWARRISLRQLENQGDRDRTLYNALGHPTKDAKWLADFNPRSPTIGCWPDEYAKKPDRRSFYPGGPALIDGTAPGASGFGLGSPGNYLAGTIVNPTDKAALELNSFIGFSDEGGISRCILFEVPELELPEQSLVSIAQLRHAHLTIENGDYDTQLSEGYGAEDWFSDNLHPAYPIGSSRPDPRLKLQENHGRHRELTIEDGKGTHTATHHDFAWHLNEHLWDGYFFSAPRDPEHSDNPRLVLLPGGEIETAPEGLIRNASSLITEGAFNIHSTNLEAWQSFLLSSLGAIVTGQADEADHIPFSRFIHPEGGLVTANHFPDDIENYIGYRSLTIDEARKLATLIVEEVAQRRPFFSLAEFVNRTAQDDAPREFQLSGLLQSAIDRSSINSSLSGGTLSIPSNHAGQIYEADSFSGDIAAATPGYLEQGDLLARTGHLLSVRSDTFLIRAYGNALRPDGTIAAEAWCEATIQRHPDFLDPEDQPETALADLTNPVNATFGRRFRIASFRWLPSSDFSQ